MTIITIMPIVINNDGKEYYYGDETGSIQYYVVKDILHEYLGEKIYVSWNYNDFTFEIRGHDDFDNEDEGFDIIDDYVRIIDTIYEQIFDKRHLRFEIYNVE